MSDASARIHKVIREWDETMQAAGGSRVPWTQQVDILKAHVTRLVRESEAATWRAAAKAAESYALESSNMNMRWDHGLDGLAAAAIQARKIAEDFYRRADAVEKGGEGC